MRFAVFMVALLGLLAARSAAYACEVSPLPQPTPLEYFAKTTYPIMAIAGNGLTVSSAEGVSLELAVLPEPVTRGALSCIREPAARGGAQRPATLEEMHRYVDLLTVAGIERSAINSKLTYGARSPWGTNPDYPDYQVGQIEIAVQPPFAAGLTAALRAVGVVLDHNFGDGPWQRAPLRIASITVRRHACDVVELARRAGADDAEASAQSIGKRLGFDSITSVDYQAKDIVELAGPGHACASQPSDLPFFQEDEPDLESIALGRGTPTIPAFRARFAGGGIFAMRGDLNKKSGSIPSAIRTSVLPLDGRTFFSRTIVLPQSLSFVTGQATFTAIVSATRGWAPGDDPSLRAAVVAHALQRARERASAIATAAHRRIGRLIAVNIANDKSPGYASCCESGNAGDNRFAVSRTIVAAWELLGAPSRAKPRPGQPDMYVMDGLMAILPSMAGSSVYGLAGRAAHSVSSGDECQGDVFGALADATRDGLAKAHGSLRALLDGGDAFDYYHSGDVCGANLRPFFMGREDENGVPLGVASVAERVLVVP